MVKLCHDIQQAITMFVVDPSVLEEGDSEEIFVSIRCDFEIYIIIKIYISNLYLLYYNFNNFKQNHTVGKYISDIL